MAGKEDEQHDLDGVIAEQLNSFKKSRAGLLGVLTSKQNNLLALLTAEGSCDNVVKDTIAAVEEAFSKFENVQFRLSDLLLQNDMMQESAEARIYYEEAKQRMQSCLDEAGVWLVGKSKPEDDKSDRRSVSSSVSQTSSFMRRSAAAKRAALEAKAEASKVSNKKILELEQQRKTAELETQQKILEMEQQRKAVELETQQLNLDVEIAAARAEEEALNQIEEEEARKRQPIPLQAGANLSTNSLSTSFDFQPSKQNILDPSIVYHHEFRPSRLDPHAEEWRGRSDQNTCWNPGNAEERRGRPEHNIRQFTDKYERPLDDDTYRYKNKYEATKETPKCYKEPTTRSVRSDFPHNMVEPTILLQQQRQLIEVLQLPKGELQKFSGDPLEYWDFMKSFDEVVGGTSVSSIVKLNRLVQSCSGPAARALKCCNTMKAEEGYTRARELLKERFGSKYMITDAWLQKLVKRSEIKPHDKTGLREFADDMNNCLEVFRALDLEYEIDSDARVREIISKLPSYCQNKFRSEAMKYLDMYGSRMRMRQVAAFIDKMAKEANDPLYGNFGMKIQDVKTGGTKNKREVFKSRGTSFNVEAKKKENVGTKFVASKVKSETDSTPRAETGKPFCQLCEGVHWLYECSEFINRSPDKRLSFVRMMKLCFNCLRTSGHQVEQCPKWSGCGVSGCKMWHSKLLHEAFEDMSKNYEVNNARTAQSYVCNPPRTETKVALPIVKVGVQAKGSLETIPVLALLDTGSNSTFCSQSLVEHLGIKGKPTTLSLATLNKGPDAEVLEVSLDLTAGGRNKKVISFSKVFALKNFPNMQNSMATQKEIEKWDHLRGIHMLKMKKKGVELIIGQDHPDCLKPLELRYGQDYEPYAMRTILGWYISGPMGKRSQEGQAISNFIHAMPTAEVSLEEQVKQFWAVDGDQHLANFKSEMSVNDQRVIDLWEQSTTFENGHYLLPIPFKSNPPELHNNRGMAEKRLQSLKRRLTKDPKLLEQYNNEIETLVAEGYAEEVPKEEIDAFPGMTWYLPAFNVTHPSKPEKFRMVFDCAAESKELSLNKSILKGPDLTNKLLGVLLRFRQNKVAVMADIEAMFHQVRVTPEHRNVLRFLWWKDGNLWKEPDIYRMNVHLFGGIWSPSCASYALQRTAKDQVSKFSPQAISTVMKNFYADDCLKSVEEEEGAIALVKELCKMLALRGFHLTKWMSNNKVLSSVPPGERAKGVKSLNLDQDALPIEHVLGLEWDTEEDQLGIRTTAKKKENTKRGLLSVLSSVYDPLGLVSPFVLLAKKIFQDECRQEKGWDEELTPASLEKWKKWLSDIPKISEFSVDRCFVPSEFGKIASYQLHHFCDASQEAYGAVSYLRIISEEGNVHCALVAAKSKLAPIKQMTIPRLELSAAVVAVKLDVTIRNELEWELSESVFWTDSMIVLQYIKNKNKRFQTFVANRVAVIQECSLSKQWRHVGTELNPADDASRGLNGEEMVNNARWKQGPDFLWQAEEQWPNCQTEDQDLLEDDKEVKQEKQVKQVRQEQISFSVISEVKESATDKLLKHYSSWFRLKKAVAWVRRFGVWLKERRSATWSLKGVNLKTEDLSGAEEAIIKYVQKNHYSKEIQALRTNQQSCPRSSSIYRLEPYIHDDELLRVRGRLQRAPISEEARHPVIMPQEHHIAELIIRDAHERVGHSGREYVMAHIRQHYWVPKARHLINRVIRRCIICKRCRGPLGVQQMASLPEERVTPSKPAFTSVGVDCFGPFLVKRGRSQEKRYGCIFTCLAVRAIHIEKLRTMDADSFINALVRFTARRGKPEKIRSDNGTNFVGGQRELQNAVAQWNESNKLQTHLLQNNIKWNFNPPTASHMGGVWERQIRTVRKILTALARNTVLDDERLDTLFCDVEAIVNSRPLTPVSSDPKDLEALTPNHLLLLRPGRAVALVQTCKQDMFGKRWKQVQFLADQFWRRWTREYLPTLQLRPKWLEQKRNVQVGDLVLLLEEGTPRQFWPLGRIEQVFKGKDSLVRAVEVRTASNKCVRPITKICLLEGCEESLKSQGNSQDSGQNNAS